MSIVTEMIEHTHISIFPATFIGEETVWKNTGDVVIQNAAGIISLYEWTSIKADVIVHVYTHQPSLIRKRQLKEGTNPWCLFSAESDKTSQTFNWAFQHSDKGDRRQQYKKHTKGEVTWANSRCVPHNGSQESLCLFWSSPSWKPALQAPSTLIYLQTPESLLPACKLSKYPRNQTPSHAVMIKDPQVNQTETETETHTTWKTGKVFISEAPIWLFHDCIDQD